MSKSENIIIIDPEEFIRDLLKEYFEGLGYRAYPASSAAEALELISVGDISVAIMDERWAIENEMEYVDKLKQARPGLRVILISGYPTLEGVINALRHGVFDIVIKPFRLEKMKDIVKRALSSCGDTTLVEEQRNRIASLEHLLIENGIALPGGNGILGTALVHETHSTSEPDGSGG